MASGDLKILTLMDLLEIKTIPQALQNIGVQIEARRMKYDVNCTTDGRFVVLTKYQEVVRGSLFSDENLFVSCILCCSMFLICIDWDYHIHYRAFTFLEYLNQMKSNARQSKSSNQWNINEFVCKVYFPCHN